VNPTLSSIPFSLCWSTSTVISYSFRRTDSELLLPSISHETPCPLGQRFRVQASGPFSLRSLSRARPPHLSLVSETTLYSLFATPQRMTRGLISSRLFSVQRSLAEWNTRTVPFSVHRHLNSPVLTFLAYGALMAQRNHILLS
jgi:hypothetical protein